MSYSIGDKPRLIATFKDGITKTLADPDVVRFRFKTPDGTETVYVFGTNAELVKESTGVYHVDLPLTSQDEWWYRWEAAGAIACALERAIQVTETQFDSV